MKIYKKPINYSILPNEILKHKLSLKAIGLYSYIISKPDDWNFSIGGVVAQSSDGKDSIRSAIQELESAGFLVRQQVRNDDGTMGEGSWLVDDKPMMAEKPMEENPTSVPPRQVNTNIVNTKEDNLQKSENPIVSLDQTVIGLPKTTQTFMKDRKVKQPFRQNYTPKPVSTTGFSARQNGTLEDSLHDNLPTEEDIKALAKELKVTPEQVRDTKKSYLIWVKEKNVLGANMMNTVSRWLLKALVEGKIEHYKNAAELHNEAMMELVHAVESGEFKI